MTKKEFVKSERQFTVDLLSKLTPEQWQANSLCAGWTVEDVAAHLITRERNVLAGIGLVVPGLHFVHDRRIEREKAKGHKYIISKLEKYPWWMASGLNTAEFYIHNEDMLRGDLKMGRPEPNNEAQEILWGALKGIAKFRKHELADLGSITIENNKTGAVISVPNKNNPVNTAVSGRPSELLLYIYGRRDAAKVTINKAKL